MKNGWHAKTPQELLQCCRETARAALSDTRFLHSDHVAQEARRLALRYGGDPLRAQVAGLLHDICKEMPAAEQLQWIEDSGIILDNVSRSQPKIWHGMAAAGYLPRKLGLSDPAVLRAVRYHTTGRAGMTLLEKIVYLADLTSAERSYPDVAQMRALVDRDLNEAMGYALDYITRSLRQDGREISPDTQQAWEQYAARRVKPDKGE